MSKDKLNNMIGYSDFKPNWKAEEAKPTKRTQVGLDVLKESEKQPKYTMLGAEKKEDTNPLFGYAAVRDQQIKKIGAFSSFTKMKDPPTPKERPILNAGIYIETESVRGHINRIEGSTVYVESLDDPMTIVEVKLKDAVKLSKEEKNEIKKFNENIYLDPEFQSLNMQDFAELISKEENIWLCAVEGSGPGQVRYNPEIQKISTADLLEIGKDAIIVLIAEDGFDSVPATLRNKCSLALIPEIPYAIKNRLRIFKLQ
jgi:hypothetical protein